MKIKKIKVGKIYTIKKDDYPFLAGERVKVTEVNCRVNFVEASNDKVIDCVEPHNLKLVECDNCIFKLFDMHYPCSNCFEYNKWRKYK